MISRLTFTALVVMALVTGALAGGPVPSVDGMIEQEIGDGGAATDTHATGAGSPWIAQKSPPSSSLAPVWLHSELRNRDGAAIDAAAEVRRSVGAIVDSGMRHFLQAVAAIQGLPT